MKRNYAVVWSRNGDTRCGRLEPFPDRFELHGRERRLAVPFAELRGGSIARRPAERLLGMPVLVLDWREGPPLRIASLEGPGFLHELADRVEHAGRHVAAA
jgi:hypothetical protein